MKIFLTLLTVASSSLLVVIILLQQGKGAELGAAFGRGAQGGLFEGRGGSNFLTRTTAALATIFLLSALSLSLLLGASRQDRVFEELERADGGAAVEALDDSAPLTDAPPTPTNAADDVPAPTAETEAAAETPAEEEAAPATTPTEN